MSISVSELELSHLRIQAYVLTYMR